MLYFLTDFPCSVDEAIYLLDPRQSVNLHCTRIYFALVKHNTNHGYHNHWFRNPNFVISCSLLWEI